ncbi:hypothetical protein AAG570_012987 [Ranatra chinensis]|uniref:Uncharacterized protein n=1 Tax=Ranatra chinensis TaxID=642074 RepID=A0ABD0YG01_9HEMI
METDTSTTEERRKSLGLLRDIAEKWTAEKYSRADSADDGPRPQPQLKMSSMEEECVRERIRMTLLRECADILDAETKYTRETFRRAFLNKETTQETTEKVAIVSGGVDALVGMKFSQLWCES